MLIKTDQTADETSGDGSSRTTNWVAYDFHGLVRVGVATNVPALRQLDVMFAPFKESDQTATFNESDFDIVVAAEEPAMTNPGHAEYMLRYDEHSVRIMESDVTVTRHGNHWGVYGTRELLVFVLPLIDVVATERGAGMIHAATFEYRGRGVAMPAWGGVGKTSTVAKLLALPDTAFYGDDWAFLRDNGDLLAYHKPMFIKPHHRPIYPHLFQDHRKPMVPSILSTPVSKLTTLVHPMVTRYPGIAGFTRRWSPEHIMVSPAEAFPDATMGVGAPLVASIFVERYDGTTSELVDVDREWMVGRMVGNFHFELPGQSQALMTAMSSTSLNRLEVFFAKKRQIIEAALGDRPNYLLRVPAEWSADRASDDIVKVLLERCDAAIEAESAS